MLPLLFLNECVSALGRYKRWCSLKRLVSGHRFSDAATPEIRAAFSRWGLRPSWQRLKAGHLHAL
jgi:hypothetical protein